MDFKTTFDVLDIQKYVEQEFAPATFVPRNGQTWLVRDQPVDFKADPQAPDALLDNMGEWGWCKTEDEVRIPLFPYCSRAADPSVAVAFAFELGFKARNYVKPNYEIKQLHISLGSPVEEAEIDGKSVLKFWLGFAYVIKER